jgi:hypothetical protein
VSLDSILQWHGRAVHPLTLVLTLSDASALADAVIPNLRGPLFVGGPKEASAKYGVLVHRHLRRKTVEIVELVRLGGPLDTSMAWSAARVSDEASDARGRTLGNADFQAVLLPLLESQGDAPATLFALGDEAELARLEAFEADFSSREDAPNFWDDCLAPLVEGTVDEGLRALTLEGISFCVFEGSGSNVRGVRVVDDGGRTAAVLFVYDEDIALDLPWPD